MAKQAKPSFYRDLGILSFFILAHAYLAFTALQGNHGLFARMQIDEQMSALRVELDEINAQIAVMENKTKRMSDEFLDLELLDELARERLGYVHPNDRIIN